MNLRRMIVPLGAFALVALPREVLAQNGRGEPPSISASTPSSTPKETAPAAPSGPSENDLAKQSQNPVANLINVPLQQNFNFKTGLSNRTQYNLNIQPVIPIPINDQFLLVTRVILPIYDQPVRASDRVFGLGDTTATVFLATQPTKAVTIGAGPAMSLPTATNAQLGSEKWALGPSIVGLVTTGPWVVGALANNLWSFTGDKDRASTNGLLVQPFVNYNLARGWSINVSPIITANWKAEGTDIWTVPIGGGVSKVMKLDNKVALNLSLQAYVNATKPIDGPDGQVRTTLALLLPE